MLVSYKPFKVKNHLLIFIYILSTDVSEFMDGIGDGSIDVQALEVALSSCGQELMVLGGDMDNLNKLLG